MADHYETLGVEKDATRDDIKKAFRKMASKHHPDKEGGSEEAFKKVKKAYETLDDPETRARYDEFGDEDEPEENTLTGRMTLVLLRIFETLDDNVPTRHILHHVRERVRAGKDKVEEGVHHLQVRVKKLRALIKDTDFEGREKDNVFLTAVRYKLRMAEEELKNAIQAKEVFTELQKLLSNTRSKTDDGNYTHRETHPMSSLLDAVARQSNRGSSYFRG